MSESADNSKTPQTPSATGVLTEEELEARHQRAIAQMRSSPGWAASRPSVLKRANVIRAALGEPLLGPEDVA